MNLIFKFILLATFVYAPLSHALSCKEYGSGKITQQVSIDKSINLSRDDQQAGEIIWRSPTYSSIFECQDTDSMRDGEDAYAYLDPRKEVQSIRGPFEVGVTLSSQGMTTDYIVTRGDRVNLGPGTICQPLGGKPGQCGPVAQPNLVRLSYNIFLRATGGHSVDYQTPDSRSVYLFQIDGVGGLNTRPDSNFQVKLNGLNNIRYIDCEPAFDVIATRGDTVEFGEIGGAGSQINKIERRIPFSIQPRPQGTACNGQQVTVSFSSARASADGVTILADNSDLFGFVIEEEDKPGVPLRMKESYDLLVLNGELQRKNYIAGFKWLTNKAPSSAAGEFSGNASVTLTFK